VRLTAHKTISRATIGRRLADNDLKPWQEKRWPRLCARLKRPAKPWGRQKSRRLILTSPALNDVSSRRRRL
jgi:hypothetical protein